MKYEDVSFLQDLKDYLDVPINKIIIHINNKIEYICYNYDRIFDLLNYIEYDELNISLYTTSEAATLSLYFKKKEGEKNE